MAVNFLRPFFLLIFLSVPTFQVDIINYASGFRNICPGIPPGVCCLRPIYTSNPSHRVEFSHLLAGDIAITWSERQVEGTSGRINRCSGRVRETKNGPGSWTWSTNYLADRAYGASYITLPKAVPPDDATARWLSAEGLLALGWGGGKWFSSEASQQRTELFLLAPFMPSRRRDVRSHLRGNAVYGSPPRWVYSSIVEVNGTDYMKEGSLNTDELHTSLVYKDRNGRVLNLTELSA
ncbi:MAG: hypothetical protein Q9181_005742 [Wetmoreana brouardii]